jgi:HAD superfamily hydrolase (TIGR01549 family)
VFEHLTEKTFSAVIFDLDGTLVGVDNIRKHADDVLKRALSDLGVERTSIRDRYRFFFCGVGFLALLEKWGITNEEGRKSFLDALSEEEYAEKKKLMEHGSAWLYKDAEVLRFLKGRLKVGLVTNSSSRATSLELGYFKIGHYFDCIVSLGDFGNHLAPKPDPDGIIYCLQMLNEPPSKSIVVGDNLTDVAAGEKSGAYTAIILRGKQKLQTRKGKTTPRIDFKLRSLRELEQIIARNK